MAALKYLGYFDVLGKDSQGGMGVVHNTLQSAVKGAHFEQVLQPRRGEGRRIDLYADLSYHTSQELTRRMQGIATILAGFEEKSTTKHNVPVRLVLLPDEDQELKGDLENIKKEKADLEKQLRELNTQSAETSREREDLRKQLEGEKGVYTLAEEENKRLATLVQEHESAYGLLNTRYQELKASVEVPDVPTPPELTAILQQEQSAYITRQEKIVLKLLGKTAEALEQSRVYQGTQEQLKEARKTLEEKAAFYTAGGESTLQHLPETAREAALESAQKTWGAAEQTLQAYEGVSPLEIIVWLQQNHESTRIIIPVCNTQQEAPRLLQRALTHYAEKLQEESLQPSETRYQGFSSVELNGRVALPFLKEHLSIFHARLQPHLKPTLYIVESVDGKYTIQPDERHAQEPQQSEDEHQQQPETAGEESAFYTLIAEAALKHFPTLKAACKAAGLAATYISARRTKPPSKLEQATIEKFKTHFGLIEEEIRVTLRK